MAHDVFISHSSKDKTVADATCAFLESRGLRCWVAPRDIRPGADWGDSIIEALQNSRAMVLIFSGHANKSPQIKREVNRAVDKEIPIIPFRIENVMPTGAMEYSISTAHWLDAFTFPLEHYLEALARAVQVILDLPATLSFAPPEQKRTEITRVSPLRNKRGTERLYILISGTISFVCVISGILSNLSVHERTLASNPFQFWFFAINWTVLLASVSYVALLLDKGGAKQSFLARPPVVAGLALFLFSCNLTEALFGGISFNHSSRLLIVDRLLNIITPLLYISYWLFFIPKGNLRLPHFIRWLGSFACYLFVYSFIFLLVTTRLTRVGTIWLESFVPAAILLMILDRKWPFGVTSNKPTNSPDQRL